MIQTKKFAKVRKKMCVRIRNFIDKYYLCLDKKSKYAFV
jgi:uncharacterized protein YjbK